MILDAFKYQFRNVFKELPKISLLGIRGYKFNPGEDNQNKIGIYDDSIISCIDGCIRIFPASVDPGKYYIQHPINPQGCAKLKCGLWHYVIGEHHTHKALVQAEEVTVDRLDRSGKRLGEDHGYFGINLHSGGPEYLVGKYSAGCQIIRSSEPWKNEWLDFFTPISVGVEFYRQKRIPYLLIDKLEAIPES